MKMDRFPVAKDSLKGILDVDKNVDVYSYTIIADIPEEPFDKCDSDGVFTNLIYGPEFPGGVQAYLEYLNENMVYPQEAAKNHVRGVIIVGFIVEKDGSISNTKVVRRVAPDNADFYSEKLTLMDNEATRLVNEMPKWVPGKHNGDVVRAYYEVPIRFRMNRTQNNFNLYKDTIAY